MHHGKDKPPDTEEKSATRQALDELDEAMKEARPGATGRFPGGRINSDDEGEIQFVIGHVRDKVIINFGKEVSWLGMDADQAEAMAKLLHKCAKKARKYAGMT